MTQLPARYRKVLEALWNQQAGQSANQHINVEKAAEAEAMDWHEFSGVVESLIREGYVDDSTILRGGDAIHEVRELTLKGRHELGV